VKFRLISIALAVILFVASVAAQRQPRFLSKYVRPATYAGLFYLQRGNEVPVDPAALVLSYNDKPIDHKPNDPDAPTIPGFYSSYTKRFDFEKVEVIGKRVYFKTRAVEGVRYEFSGLMGTYIDPNFNRSIRIPFIKGTLIKWQNRKPMSQENIRFIHAVIA
jgi:hypothetical protein